MSEKRTGKFVNLLLSTALLLLINKCVSQEIHTCKGVDINLTEEHAMSIDECMKAANATSLKDINPDAMACLGKCVIENTGLVDHDGKPHKENIFQFVRDTLPPEVHDDIQIKFEKCLDEETEEIDPNDESCISYLPLCMCIHLAFLEECH